MIRTGLLGLLISAAAVCGAAGARGACAASAPVSAAVADTVDSTAAPSAIMADSTAGDKIAEGRKMNIFRRLYRYFDESNEDKTRDKRFDMSFILGPSYSNNTKFTVGMLAAGLYRVDREDMSLPPSDVSLFGSISTTGSYTIGVSGNTIFRQDRHRLSYEVAFYSRPTDFWGIGYENGEHGERGHYTLKEYRAFVDFKKRVTKGFYMGAGLKFNYSSAHRLSIPEYLAGQRDGYVTSGAGLFAEYDTRDFIPNAFRGVYLSYAFTCFPAFAGTSGTFYRSVLQADLYHRVWKGATLAYDFYSEYNFGDVPWTMLSRMGGSYRMRGYYEGRYRDKAMTEVQVELRQKIYNRHGVVAWVGAGNVYPDVKSFTFKHTLPNYGLGYRWEFKNRVNIRIDYGFGRGQSGFMFNINEAF